MLEIGGSVQVPSMNFFLVKTRLSHWKNGHYDHFLMGLSPSSSSICSLVFAFIENKSHHKRNPCVNDNFTDTSAIPLRKKKEDATSREHKSELKCYDAKTFIHCECVRRLDRWLWLRDTRRRWRKRAGRMAMVNGSHKWILFIMLCAHFAATTTRTTEALLQRRPLLLLHYCSCSIHIRTPYPS